MNQTRPLVAGALLVVLLAGPALAAETPLELKKGDRIALVGNALADRMQHHGWLETLIHARFPRHELVFRNLAVAGDEAVTRHRSENFGSPDEWLTRVRADVIFAFFGFNESFKGKEGVERFKADLDRFLKETARKRYNGRSAPRVVLFSPIAAERHRDPNYPDPAPINANLALYAAAMAEVARANGVEFVDLFEPSQRLYAEAARRGTSLTINGLHLTEAADRLLAMEIVRDLFEGTASTDGLEPLRKAVNAKNAQWHARYRTVDGYNVYGGRSRMAYESPKGGPQITNFKVMQEEMAQRDALTANRDVVVWAAAQGRTIQPDDSNLPPVTQVKSNKPGPNPDASHVFTSGRDAIAKMKVHRGMRVNLFAAEDRFPQLVNPVQMAWDTRGRLWVAVWPNYPERTPTSKSGDSLLIFEDTDGDGEADTCTPFIEDLNCPTGFQFYKDGVLLMQAPDLWFVRDTDGDGRADWKERVLMGIDSADSHHTTNAMAWDPGGAVYLSDGVFHRTQVETAEGPVRNDDAAIFRFEPRTGRFETYIAYGFANPHGRVFDRWGNDLVTDATGNNTYFGPAFSGRLDYPAKHKGMKEFWARPSRPCPGTGMLSSRHFPAEFQGNFLNLNVIGFQGIYRVKVSEDGSGLKGETLEDIVSSKDPNFRPTAVSIGPDGAIYFTDWHNPIIGHLQHHIRDPNRDHAHGRIYRITYEGRPLLRQPKIHGQPIPALLDLLKEHEDGVRELAKVELSKHDSARVVAEVRRWIERLDPKDPDHEHHMMEALWVHQWHNVVADDLLRRMLRSPEPRARAAATRVLCYWRDRVSDVIALLKVQAADEHPRVRLEAVRAASFFRTADAADVALTILKHPTDYYLDYTLGETMRQLEPHWRKALAEGKPPAADVPAAVQYLMRTASAAELLKLPKTVGVLEAILLRHDLNDDHRTEALNALAELKRSSRSAAILDLIEATTRAAGGEVPAHVARLLPLQPASDLAPQRARLEALTAATSPAVRRAAWGALALADDSFDRIWPRAAAKPHDLADLIAGIPTIYAPDVRAKAYDRIAPLLAPGAPAGSNKATTTGPVGRYVRIELPRRGTLTLAEVEVLSGGRNVGPSGKASQSSVGYGGEPSRALDGRTDGSYGSGTQTHTVEDERRPWWEVDLGSERPIEAVVVWNRTDGNLGRRLDGFTLTVLDARRRPVFTKEKNPAPSPKLRIEVGPGGPPNLRALAIEAAVSMQYEPEAIFGMLATLIEKGDDIAAAARGLRALPRQAWDKPRAGRVARTLVAWAKTVPAADRTGQDYLETTQFAQDLVGLLPPAEQAPLRRDLKELRVAVFVLTTVKEQMRYDTPRLVVEAGKPFEIILENTDFMPHNLVVVTPGSREKVGTLSADMTPDQLDSQGRAFVPKTPEVLAATRLLEPGQRQTLKMVAPTKEGVYEFVCTYPGHWEQMWGRLVVTKDVDAYLEANPDSSLPKPGKKPKKSAAAATDAHHGH